MFSNVLSWQQPAHTEGWQRTSWVKSSLPLIMGIFYTSAGKRVLKQTNKQNCVQICRPQMSGEPHQPCLGPPAPTLFGFLPTCLLVLKHVNHLFYSWHPQHKLGSPKASCCPWDPPDKGAVMNLSETTVFHTQENTVNEIFFTMLPTSSTTIEHNTYGFHLIGCKEGFSF